MTMAKNSIIWIVPEQRGGIGDYSRDLWAELQAAGVASGWSAIEMLRPVSKDEQRAVLLRLAELKPNVVHVQHEYGFFGGKKPFQYRFPAWIRALRKTLPNVCIVSTAHTVLTENYRFPTAGKGWQTPFRYLANLSVLPILRRSWREGSWGNLDGVVVHSSLQKNSVQKTTRAQVREIPLFVPRPVTTGQRELSTPVPHDLPWVLIFGFLTPDKGHDVALRAWLELRGQARLVIAGSVRRPEDQAYGDSIRRMATDLGLTDSVSWIDYVPEEEINALYRQATLVLTPFRETTGSASITHAFARGRPVLASDLPLNRELNLRKAGTVALFPAGDSHALASEIKRLLMNESERVLLGSRAQAYASIYSPEVAALAHLEFYRQLLESNGRLR